VKAQSPFELIEVLASVPRGGSAGEVRVRRVRLVETGTEMLDVRVFKKGWRGDDVAGKGLCLRPNEAPVVSAALLKGVKK
jgi:hypothetical protein